MTLSNPFDAERLAADASGVIDADSSEPLHRQVRRYLESMVANETFHRNRPLPSSRFLATTLGVSRNTVNLAYQDLVALGLIESRPRSGLYPTALMVGEQGGRSLAVDSFRSPAAPSPAPTAVPVDRADSVSWSRRIVPLLDDRLPHSALRTDWAQFPYPFIPGQPELARFPVRGWLRALTEATARPHLRYSVQDSVDTDDPLLVEVIRREILPARGLSAEPSEIIITGGAQQALALVADALVTPDMTVGLETPGYRDAAHIFSRHGARLEFVPVDDRGARVPDDSAHDLLYLTPSHHHPTNVTLSLARRQQLLAAAARDDTLVIEDDYDSEVRFVGRPTPSLKSLDVEGRVIYVGTFSKFVAPGLRIGFVVANAELVDALRRRRRYTTKHAPGHVQRALALFIESGDYHRALRQHRNHLKKKWDVLSSSLPDALGFEPEPLPAGGMAAWVRGPEWFDGTRVADAALGHGVLVDPGEAFYLGEARPHNEMRVGFSAISIAAIPAGLAALGEAVREVHPS